MQQSARKKDNQDEARMKTSDNIVSEKGEMWM